MEKHRDPYKAAEDAKSIRKHHMSQLPVPYKDPVFVHKMFNDGRLKLFYEEHKEWYTNCRNLFSVDALLREHEISYKRMPEEAFADEFSTKMILKYWNHLGFDNLR